MIKSGQIKHEQLKNQVKEFMGIMEDEFENEQQQDALKLTNPGDIFNFIKVKLDQSPEISSSFSNVLKYLLLITIQKDYKKLSNSWRAVEEIIANAVQTSKEGDVKIGKGNFLSGKQ